MNSKTFILLAVSIFLSSNVYAQKTYTVEGKVFDSQTNHPIKNAQVWLYGAQAGAVTDSLGNFKLEVLKSYSSTRMYVRVCGDVIATSKLMEFRSDSYIKSNFSVVKDKSDCPSPPNIPWKVKPSEYESYQGYLILDMHGVFLRTCSGNPYRPVWPIDFRVNEIWPDNAQFGDSLFIQLKGRLDPYSKEVIPFQNLYVGEIVFIDTVENENCDLN